MSEERRKNSRVSVMLDVKWEALSSHGGGARVSDLSSGGCYVETLAQVSRGEKISFSLALPTGRLLPLKGEVMYVHPTMGFGLRFVSMSEAEQEVLNYLIEYYKG